MSTYQKKFKFRKSNTNETIILTKDKDSVRIDEIEDKGFKGGKNQTEADIIKAEEFNYLFKGIDNEFTNIQDKFTNLDSSISTINNKNNEQDSRLNSVENRATKIESRVSKIESKDIIQDRSLENIKNDLGLDYNTANQNGNVKQRIKDLENRTLTIEPKVSTHTNDINELKKRTKELEDKTQNLELNKANQSDLDSSNQRITTLENTTSNHTSRLDSMDLTINSINNQTNTNESDIKNLKDKTSSLESNKANKEDVRSLESKVLTHTNDIDDLKKNYNDNSLIFTDNVVREAIFAKDNFPINKNEIYIPKFSDTNYILTKIEVWWEYNSNNETITTSPEVFYIGENKELRAQNYSFIIPKNDIVIESNMNIPGSIDNNSYQNSPNWEKE